MSDFHPWQFYIIHKHKDVNVDNVTKFGQQKGRHLALCLEAFQYRLKKERFWISFYFHITFYCKKACKLPKHVLKESKNVILRSFCFVGHLYPCAYLPKWSPYAHGSLRFRKLPGINNDLSKTRKLNLLPWNHLESYFKFGAQIAEKITKAQVLMALPATASKRNKKGSFSQPPRKAGGYSTKFVTERLRPEVQPLTLLHTIIHEKGTLFVYLLLTNGISFTYLV